MEDKTGVKNAKKFRREVLLKDPRFAKYQKDFLAAILPDEEYTVDDALAKARAFFERGGKT